MVSIQSLLYVLPLLWAVCCMAEATGKSRRKTNIEKKHNLLTTPAQNIDYIMMAPPLASENTTNISTKAHEPKMNDARNTTHHGIIVRFMYTFWNSSERKSRSRRLLEMTLKPMFFICCLCVLVLIYLLYRAVRIRRNLKNDKHVIQPTHSDNIYQNDA